MSFEAVVWALNDAPDVAPHEVAVLVGLAEHAHPDGSTAMPAVPKLAKYSRKGDRAVQKDLSSLLAKGLIRHGDQRAALIYPPDRRPIVYDLAMERRQDGGVLPTPTKPASGKPAQPVVPIEAAPSYRPNVPSTPRGAAAAKAALEAAEAKKRERLRNAKKCPVHPGELAHNCGPCLGELLGVK